MISSSLEDNQSDTVDALDVCFYDEKTVRIMHDRDRILHVFADSIKWAPVSALTPFGFR